MDILINDVVLDFTLEKEKKIKEVWNSLDKWVNGNNSVILSARIITNQDTGSAIEIDLSKDGETSSYQGEDFSIDNIKKLEV